MLTCFGALDEERPTCNRCEKAGYDCAGYERKLEFRTHSFQDVAKPQANKAKAVVKPADQIKQRGRLLESEVVLTTVPGCLSLIAFKDDMQFAYLFSNFVWSGYGTPWLQLSALGRMDPLSSSACRAFAQTVFAKHHYLKDIEIDGSIKHGSVIQDLSSKLSNVGDPGSEYLIVPIMILLIYSVTRPLLHAFAMSDMESSPRLAICKLPCSTHEA